MSEKLSLTIDRNFLMMQKPSWNILKPRLS